MWWPLASADGSRAQLVSLWPKLGATAGQDPRLGLRLQRHGSLYPPGTANLYTGLNPQAESWDTKHGIGGRSCIAPNQAPLRTPVKLSTMSPDKTINWLTAGTKWDPQGTNQAAISGVPISTVVGGGMEARIDSIMSRNFAMASQQNCGSSISLQCPARGTVSNGTCAKTLLLLNFSHVCPEPVSVK
jgi:hypothetical protein